MEQLVQHTFASTIAVIAFIVLFGVAIVDTFIIVQLRTDVAALQQDVFTASSTINALGDSLMGNLHNVETNAVSLSDQLYKEQQRTQRIEDALESFDEEFGTLSGSVRTLEKLTTTDPELLQKYSRVYFLNENYVPSDLTVIDEEYDLPNGKQVSVLTDMWPFLKNLLRDAKRDGVLLNILSGYRSFAEQTTLKKTYAVQYGVGANQFSADQGYSEHQLGTAVDFTTPEGGEDLDLFERSDAYVWLRDHAYRYGFILSYPEGNTYYQYEPWHWRFVGVDLATKLHRTGKTFYDLEQRELDAYLSTLFDN